MKESPESAVAGRMPPGGWAGLLFDLDGTLADTVDLILRCYRHTITVHRGRPLPDAQWLATIGRPLLDQFALFARDPEEVLLMRDTYVSHQNEIHDDLVKPFPGVSEMLDHFQEVGVPMAIVTSKARKIARRTLDGCGIGGAFDLLICADDVANGKPHPEPVELALTRMDLADRRAEVLFVGDSPYDLRAGRAAGTRTGAALWGPYARDTLELESPDFYFTDVGAVSRTRP